MERDIHKLIFASKSQGLNKWLNCFDFSTDVRWYRKLTGKLLKSRFWGHRTSFEANFLASCTTFLAKTFGRFFFVIWHFSRSQITVSPSFKSEDLRTWKYSYLVSFSKENDWKYKFWHMTPIKGSYYSFPAFKKKF